MNAVLNDIAVERHRQEGKGYDPNHDDQHGRNDWLGFVMDRITSLALKPDRIMFRRDDRQELIEIAALAVAAAESIDRRCIEIGATP